jgi:pimeloyl-ACP methyl ester carboxylesterase
MTTTLSTVNPSACVTPPASTPAVTIASHGERLVGVLHLPEGPGPHPVVVLLHGFPGHERNFDLAQALRRVGYASLVFHYRGSWGVGGTWSWHNVLDDATRVVAAVQDDAMSGPHRLDSRRVAVVGHSLGGFAALTAAAGDTAVRAVVSVAGFDLAAGATASGADPAVRAGYVTAWDADLLPLRGTSGEALVAEMEVGGPGWSLAALAPRLADRAVLLIGTGQDAVTPAEVHHHPLVAAYEAHPVERLEHCVFPTDHALSDHRVACKVVDFLDRHLRRQA